MAKEEETQNPIPYRRRDMCALIHKGVDEKLKELEKQCSSINLKISATLIFVIVLLVSFIIELLKTTL